jgi:hypothetical protein
MRIYFTGLSYRILREKVSPSEWAGAIANELHRFFGGAKGARLRMTPEITKAPASERQDGNKKGGRLRTTRLK